MVSDHMAMVLALLDRSGGPVGAGGLSRAAASAACVALGVDGIAAGIGTGPHGAALAWSDGVASAALEDRQFTLGEGPGLEAVATGVPVLVADLADAATRWPGFAPAAAELGVRAVFAFPLRIGAISVGALLAHRTTPGLLAGERLTDALALADTVTTVLMQRQSEHQTAGGVPSGWAAPVTYRAEVHQATGMVSVQLGISLAEALVRLRAHAWGSGQLLGEVAADVVARRLRFDDTNL